MRLALTIAAGALLASCATHAPPTPVLPVTCLPVATYSPAEQRQLASELSSIGEGSMISRAIVDYGAMRDAARAACGGAK